MRRLQLRRRVRSRGETPGAWRRTVRDILRQPHIRSFQDLASVAYDDAVDDNKFAERLKAWAGQHTPRNIAKEALAVEAFFSEQDDMLEAPVRPRPIQAAAMHSAGQQRDEGVPASILGYAVDGADAHDVRSGSRVYWSSIWLKVEWEDWTDPHTLKTATWNELANMHALDVFVEYMETPEGQRLLSTLDPGTLHNICELDDCRWCTAQASAGAALTSASARPVSEEAPASASASARPVSEEAPAQGATSTKRKRRNGSAGRVSDVGDRTGQRTWPRRA